MYALAVLIALLLSLLCRVGTCETFLDMGRLIKVDINQDTL